MANAPDFDAFLADPCGVWAEHGSSISLEWSVQAARSSRAFREQLRSEVSASIEASGSFEDAEQASDTLAKVFDAQDIAELFGELARVRPPAEWAADFARRFK